MKKIMFISSTGGHLSELMQLKPLFEKCDYYIVTEKDKTTVNLKEKYKDKIFYLVYGARNYLFSYIFKFLFNIIKSFYIFLKMRPDVVITTGAHTGVPMCYIAKLFNKKVIFIESFARVYTKSLSGRLTYKIADLFLVQHEELLDVYPNAKYEGSLY